MKSSMEIASYPSSCANHIKKLDDAIKSYNSKVKELREKRKDVHEKLSEWMRKKGLEEYEGIPIIKSPKERKKPVTKKYKTKEMEKLFSEIGVPDPSDLINRINKINEGKR